MFEEGAKWREQMVPIDSRIHTPGQFRDREKVGQLGRLQASFVAADGQRFVSVYDPPADSTTCAEP